MLPTFAPAAKTSATSASVNWCRDFFSDVFASAHLVRHDTAVLTASVRFLQRMLHLEKGMRVFDQCCGVGDVSLALAAQGLCMMGVDLMPSYIGTATRRARDMSLDCRFVAADAGDFVPDTPCDAAFNWWTSFGYSAEDEENIRMLHRAWDALKPGGFFALDYMNAPARRAAFAGRAVVEDVYALPDGGVSRWESRLQAGGTLLQKTWYYTDASGKTQVFEGQGAKLYTAAALRDLLQAAGFGNVRFYGSDAGDDYTQDSPRCIAVAQKREKPI